MSCKGLKTQQGGFRLDFSKKKNTVKSPEVLSQPGHLLDFCFSNPSPGARGSAAGPKAAVMAGSTSAHAWQSRWSKKTTAQSKIKIHI